MIKHFSTIILISLITIAIGLSDTSEKYSFKIETSVNCSLHSSWLIGHYEVNSRFECLAKCNLITSCYSVTYNTDSNSINNCALFSKVFLTNELILLKNTNLYFKECKINILFGFFLIKIFVIISRLSNKNIK